MEHAFSKVVAILTATVLFFMLPLMIAMQRQEAMIQLYIWEEIVRMVDTVRNMGNLSYKQYEQYLSDVTAVLDGAEITMLHTTGTIHQAEDGLETIQKTVSEKEIIETLEQAGNYLFQKGDFFRVTVRKKFPGLAERFLHVFSVGDKWNPDVYVYYGGSIRYED